VEPSRQFFWNIRNHSFLYIATIVATVSLVVGFAVRIGAWWRGRKVGTAGNHRFLTTLRAIVSQKRVIRGRLYLIMHRCVFYGMLLLFVGSILVALETHLGLNFLHGAAYLAFSLILEMAGAAVLIGIGLAAYKRYIVRPERLESRYGDALMLVLLATVVLSGFLVKGERVLATADPWAAWSPFGHAVAALAGKISDAENARAFHALLWYGHAALAFTLIALIPWTKLLHLLAVPMNYYLSLSWAERASLAAPHAGFTLFPGDIADSSRKQLVEADACIECGRCKKLCSIYQAGIPYAPITMMKRMKRLMHRGSLSRPLVGDVIDEDALWSCTACRSCEDRCPMNGAHASRIVDIRRGRIVKRRAPDTVMARCAEQEAALAAAGKGNPTPDMNADVHIWPGCREGASGRTDTITTLVNILKGAGVNASLLEPPACCGGPVRRLGNESLFQRNAAANIRYLEQLEGKTIITPCPHCFNTLKNEYPHFGGSFRVLHHSRYLAELLTEGKLRVTESQSCKAVFHDPCFLGRYNAEFSAPRKLIGAANGIALLKMKHSRMKSFCCGSGGGTVPASVALSNGRALVRQAVKEGADTVVTCCPYCYENLTASASEEYLEKPPQILDVIEFFV
jgi:Fe-S oxidoreductase/nitrate reductase gamma subunit